MKAGAQRIQCRLLEKNLLETFNYTFTISRWVARTVLACKAFLNMFFKFSTAPILTQALSHSAVDPQTEKVSMKVVK